MGALFLGTHHQQRVAQHLNAEGVVASAPGYTGSRELLGQHHLLQGAHAAAAVLFGPVGRQIPMFEQRLAPCAHELLQLQAIKLTDAHPSLREVGSEERANGATEFFSFDRVGHIHIRNCTNAPQFTLRQSLSGRSCGPGWR